MKISSVKKIIFYVLIYTVIFLIGYKILNSFMSKLNERRLEECSREMHITFPPATKLLYYRHTGWMGESIMLKVKFEKKYLETFIKSSPFAREKLRNIVRRGDLGPSDKYASWNTIKAKNYLWGEVEPEGALNLDIVIDLDNPDIVFVYLDLTISS